MYELRNKLEAECKKILKKEFDLSTDIHMDVSLDKERGDFTTSAALALAKKTKKSPRDIAGVLAKGLEKVEGVASVEIAGAGFVNISVSPEALIAGISTARKALSPKKKRKEAPVIVEYSSPNIAKPFGIHHILTTIIGQALANIHTHEGFPVVAINHIGDWGTQFGKLAVAHKKWGTKPIEEYSVDELLDLYVRFHEEAEKQPSLEEEGRAAFTVLEGGDKDIKKFWKVVVERTMTEVERMYERLHVLFDETLGESFYEDKMASVIDEGKKKGIFTEGEKGALVVEFPEEKKIPTALVVKGDGSTLYLTRDLATIRYRVDTWHPQAILYVVDVAQQNHFNQLFEIVHMLGWELPQLEHVIFGRMRFADGSMSTRKGNILRLEQVLDEAVKRADGLIKERGEKIQTDNPKALAEMMGTGSVVYGILSQNRKMDVVFDWDKMLTFEGNSAPYVQYTHARARSVLRKAGEEGAVTDVETLTTYERTLLKLLLTFGDVLSDARKDHLPHKLTNYLYQLCQAFNAFYQSDEIVTAPKDARALRLQLTLLTADTLKVGANILTLQVPDRM